MGSLIAAILIVEAQNAAPARAQGVPAPDASAISKEEANERGNSALNRKDYATALTWFRESAKGGHPPAEYALGLMYFDGEGIAQDRKAGLKLIRKSADVGYPPAQLKLGTLYMTGNGVKLDQAVGAAWIEKFTVSQNAINRSKQPAPINADVALWCDIPTVASDPVRSLVSIDTKSKSVKVEISRQGTLEYRDGVFGKVATSGYIAERAVAVKQFVEVSGEDVRFGFTNKDLKQDNTVNLRTGIMRTKGQPVECTVTPSR